MSLPGRVLAHPKNQLLKTKIEEFWEVTIVGFSYTIFKLKECQNYVSNSKLKDDSADEWLSKLNAAENNKSYLKRAEKVLDRS